MSNPKIALITGASTGLGAEFARQLGRRGYSLILTARRQSKLAELSRELLSQSTPSVEYLSADFADPAGIQAVVSRINSSPGLDLVVNNAGFGTNGKFAEVALFKHAAMLNVHCSASVLVTHAALPKMISQRAGTIINVASLAGLIPVRSVLYGTTKAFLINFSEALQLELKGTGVRVQALCPGFTYTEFHDTPEYPNFNRRKIPRFFWMTAEQVVKESLSALTSRNVICVPGFQYKWIAALSRNSISGWFIRFFGTRYFHK